MYCIELKKLNEFVLYSICSSSASPESGLGTSHTSLPGSMQVNDHGNDEFENEPLQPLGSCRALYPFDGMILKSFCFHTLFLS